MKRRERYLWNEPGQRQVIEIISFKGLRGKCILSIDIGADTNGGIVGKLAKAFNPFWIKLKNQDAE